MERDRNTKELSSEEPQQQQSEELPREAMWLTSPNMAAPVNAVIAPSFFSDWSLA